MLKLSNYHRRLIYRKTFTVSNLSKNFIDNIKIVVPPSKFIEKLNLAAIVEQMTLNTKEIILLEELQATVLAQLSSR